MRCDKETLEPGYGEQDCEPYLCGEHMQTGEEVALMDEEKESEEIVVDMLFGEKRQACVMDTGAFSVWVDKKFFTECGGELLPDDSGAVDVEGSPIDVSGRGYLTFQLWGRVFKNYPVRVLSSMPSNVLIGRRFWMKHKLQMDLGLLRAKIFAGGHEFGGRLRMMERADIEEIRPVIEDADVDKVLEGMDFAEFDDDVALQEKLRATLLNHRDIFKGVGRIKGYQHVIKLEKDTEPVALPIRRRSPAEEKAEREAVERLLRDGIMEKSESPWAATNVFVPKKDRTLRVTSDFRGLNARTLADSYPMEGVKETLDWLSRKKVFSTFDLKDGYFQVELAEESRKLTAVRTVLGLVQYCRLPQGMKNSPAVFQRLVNQVLGALKGDTVWAFMDDGSVGTEDAESHLAALEGVLSRMKAAGMKLKLAKCRFGVRSVEVLGHRVTPDGLLPSEGHIQAIKELREPRNGTQLLRFIGLMTYFADFIADFADKSRPLNDLLRGSGFNKKKRHRGQVLAIPEWDSKWGDAQREAWRTLKDELSNPLILAAPRSNAPKRVMTDASDYGVGGVLLQQNDDGIWQPVSFTSRKLKDVETRYTVTEKECLAVVHSLRKWRHYLHGVPTFTVVTDHIALKWLMNLKDPRGRLARWMLEVQDFDFHIEYAPGATLTVPDTLSRDAVGEPFCIRCRERVKLVSEKTRELPTVEAIRSGQENEYGCIEEYVKQNESFIMDEDDMLCKMDGKRIRVVVPTLLREDVLRYFHGSKACGHYGVARTSYRIKERFWWPTWKSDVTAHVKKCVNCSVQNLSRPGKQGKMKMWHPVRRFQVMAVDVLEVSPRSRDGNIKVLVMGDLFTRYVWAVPIRDEKAPTVALVILNEWMLRFGPPERMLSDRGKNFVSEIILELCERVGTRKIFTSPYHPQTDGFVERFNRTIMRDIRAYVSIEEDDWDQHVALACFRYNTTVNEATGMSPYRAVFGIDAFDFDAQVGRRMLIDQEMCPEKELGSHLSSLHFQLLSKGTAARAKAAKQYDKLVAGAEYEVGDRVMVYHPRLDTEIGRKLRTPWMGPYLVEEKLTSIAYMLRSESTHQSARVHVNRLRAFDENVHETSDALDGVFPDSRRLIKSITGDKRVKGTTFFKVKRIYSRGSDWVSEADLPELVVAEYKALTAGQ